MAGPGEPGSKRVAVSKPHANGKAHAAPHAKIEPPVTRPPKLLVNFRQLDDRALWNYIAHHNIRAVSVNASREELVATCVRHFEAWDVDPEAVLNNFEALSQMGAGRELLAPRHKRPAPSEYAPNPQAKGPISATFQTGLLSARFTRAPVSPSGRTFLRRGEQAAAKAGINDENSGEWILVVVVKYWPHLDKYEVHDEEDETNKMIVDANWVLPLSRGTEELRKGEDVLAMYPETTSFYNAKVARAPKKGSHADVLLQFQDDQDQDGVDPQRKVPVRFVIRFPAHLGSRGRMQSPRALAALEEPHPGLKRQSPTEW